MSETVVINDPVESFIRNYPYKGHSTSKVIDYLQSRTPQASCEQWIKGYWLIPRRNVRLKKFVRQKIEETAVTIKNLLFSFAVTSDAKKRWSILQKLKPFLEQTPWPEIEKICQEDPFIRNVNSPELIFSALMSFRKEHCDCQN